MGLQANAAQGQYGRHPYDELFIVQRFQQFGYGALGLGADGPQGLSGHETDFFILVAQRLRQGRHGRTGIQTQFPQDEDRLVECLLVRHELDHTLHDHLGLAILIQQVACRACTDVRVVIGQ